MFNQEGFGEVLFRRPRQHKGKLSENGKLSKQREHVAQTRSNDLSQEWVGGKKKASYAKLCCCCGVPLEAFAFIHATGFS